MALESLRSGTPHELISAVEMFGGDRTTPRQSDISDALVFNAIPPHLPFAKTRVLTTACLTAGAGLAIGFAQWRLVSQSGWWWFGLPVALYLLALALAAICELIRPYERYCIRVDAVGLTAEVATLYRDFGHPSNAKFRIDWLHVDGVERFNHAERELLVLHTSPNSPALRGRTRLPRYEPALGEYAVVVCPLDYFAEDAELVTQLVTFYAERQHPERLLAP